MSEKICIAYMKFDELMRLFSCIAIEDCDFYYGLAEKLVQINRQKFIALLDTFSDEQLRAAISTLSANAANDGTDISAIKIISKYLEHSNALIISDAIDSLRFLGAKNWEDIKLLSNHPSCYVRGAVLRFAKYFFGPKSLKILLEGLNDKHPIVKQNAMDELDTVATVSNMPQIVLYLNDKDQYVRMAAQSLLNIIVPAPLDSIKNR